MTDERTRDRDPGCELERLLAHLLAGDLDEAGRRRLNELAREDEQALERIVETLEVEALLQWHHGAVGEIEILPAARGRSGMSRRAWTGFLLAAGLLVALSMWGIWTHPGGTETPMTHSDAPTTRAAHLIDGWRIKPMEDAVFEDLGENLLELDRGELLVESWTGEAPGAARKPLRIRTPQGEARATGTRFYIASHTLQPRRNQAMQSLTRVLVLSGAVTLSNALGAVSGGPGDLLKTAQDQEPSKVVVRASAAFAFDLYGRLRVMDAEANLFFSPLSVSSALAMAAEGARGKTATEIFRALRMPEGTERWGTEAQRIAWQASLLHTGMARIRERLARSERDPKVQAIRARIAKLREKLDAANEEARRIRSTRKWQEFDRAAARTHEIAAELRPLIQQVDQFQLDIANALWCEKTMPLNPAFVDTLREHYGTDGAFSANFKGNPEGERVRINEWIEQATRGRIQDLIAPGEIDHRMRLVLANAIYFQGKWLEPFHESGTKLGDFQLDGGETARVHFMHDYKSHARYGAFRADGSPFPTPKLIKQKGEERPLYPDEGGFEVLELPYKGGELSMLWVLPRSAQGLKALEVKLSADELESWLEGIEARDIHTVVPRFELESSFVLNDALQQLGIQDAFVAPDPAGGADFRGVTAPGVDAQLFLSKVLHRAQIQVHERGTEAVAVTVGLMDTGAAAPVLVPFTPRFEADRPFLFLIRDHSTGAILFMGRYVRP